LTLATLLLFLSLGLDTLAVALGLGLAGVPRSRWLKVGLTFALFEGLMPVVGLLLGQGLRSALSEIATYAAAIILIIVGLLGIREARSDEGEGVSAAVADDNRRLLLTGLSVSLDEFAVGFSLGVLKVPLGLALGYVAVQAFALTFVGLWLGTRVGARLGERAALISGVVLTGLGVLLLINQVTGSGWL
jgi:manganese efflux pump family protein